MDKLMVALGAGFVFWAIGDAVVRIIKAGKSGGSKLESRVKDLETDLSDVEQELEEARKRISVLEKIVTDAPTDLKRQIDGL